MNEYIVIKAYNNNVLLVKNEQGEAILVGKGIGFKYKPKSVVPIIEAETTKVFSAQKGFSNISATTKKLEVVVEQINKAVTPILGELKDPLKSQMSDHIGFAIERAQKGMHVANDFNDAIKLVHARAYKASAIAQEIIRQQLGIAFYEDEKCFIALYLQASANNHSLMEVVSLARIVKTSLELVSKELRLELDPYQTCCTAFMIHVKMCINSEKYNIKIDPQISEIDSEKAQIIAQKVAELIIKEKNIFFTKSLVNLLALDILFIIQCNKLF